VEKEQNESPNSSSNLATKIPRKKENLVSTWHSSTRWQVFVRFLAGGSFVFEQVHETKMINYQFGKTTHKQKKCVDGAKIVLSPLQD